MPVSLNQLMVEITPERRREIELNVGRQIIDLQPDMKSEILIADGTEHHYRIFWSDEDNEYVAVHSGFPGLSWLEPDRADAFKGLYDLIQDIRKDLAMESLKDLATEDLDKRKSIS